MTFYSLKVFFLFIKVLVLTCVFLIRGQMATHDKLCISQNVKVARETLKVASDIFENQREVNII